MDNTFTVTGIAHNGKGGALVVTLNDEVYYIEGMDEWLHDLENKTVIVTGNLKIDTVSEEELINENGEVLAGRAGKIMTIQSAEWKIIESND